MDHEELARKTAVYYRDLITRNVPSDLAAQLVRDWHTATLLKHSEIAPCIYPFGNPQAIAEAIKAELVALSRQGIE